MVELVSRSSETCLDIPQAFAVSELSKGHAEKLVPAGKAFDLVIAVVLCDAFAKFVDRKEVHQL
jgi:2-C-methyl-D-erythritol 4-phosphate cytidylyltransferase